jgi:hypothetical protein
MGLPRREAAFLGEMLRVGKIIPVGIVSSVGNSK